MEGKSLFIAIVIVFSSMSFTIGFFVGKTGGGGGGMSGQGKTAIPSVANATETVELVPKPTMRQERPKETADTKAAETEEVVETNIQKDNGQASLKRPDMVRPSVHEKGNSTPKADKNTVKDASSSKEQTGKVKEVAKTDAAGPSGHSKVDKGHTNMSSGHTEASIQGKEVESEQSNETYFIQLGAFKGIDQANILKEQLKGQGFESKILKQTLKDKPTLYKVRIGDFANRQDATLNLARLNKKGFKGFIRGYTR